MINLTHLLIAAILTGDLLYIIFPKVVYLLSELISKADEVAEYSQEQADDFARLLIVRLVYLVIYMIARAVMVIAFVPMIILWYIELFGGFIVDEETEG